MLGGLPSSIQTTPGHAFISGQDAWMWNGFWIVGIEEIEKGLGEVAWHSVPNLSGIHVDAETLYAADGGKGIEVYDVAACW